MSSLPHGILAKHTVGNLILKSRIRLCEIFTLLSYKQKKRQIGRKSNSFWNLKISEFSNFKIVPMIANVIFWNVALYFFFKKINYCILQWDFLICCKTNISAEVMARSRREIAFFFRERERETEIFTFIPYLRIRPWLKGTFLSIYNSPSEFVHFIVTSRPCV